MKFEYAYSTLPCDGWDVARMADAARTLGYEAIELREGIGGISVSGTKEEWERAAAVFRSAGIRVIDIGSSLSIRDSAPQQLPVLERLAEMASVFGAQGVRVFLGSVARRKDAPEASLDHAGIVEWLKAACGLAAAFGVGVWIETHNQYGTGRVLRALLDEVGRENCAVIYDILHPLEDGETPEETIKALGADCVHVHLKDGRPSSDPLDHDWFYTPLGEGEAPIAAIVGLLEQSGYKGALSLEWEPKWREELRALGLPTEQVLADYIHYMEALRVRRSGREAHEINGETR